MSYYDVDAILTDAEKVPCQFEIDVPYLGHLDNSPHGLKSGTPLLLPLWLAEMLALASATGSGGRLDGDGEEGGGRALLTLRLPPCLSDAVAAALRADPRAVSLRDQSAHFFGVCVRMLELFDEPALGALVRRSFVVRAADVGLHARKAEEGVVGSGGVAGPSAEEFLRGLDEWERGLFRTAHQGVKGVREWLENVKRT